MSQYRKGDKSLVTVLIPTAQTTTNSYADVSGSIIDTLLQSSVAIVLKNTHGSNSIDWKVLASIDGTTYVEAQAEATLTTGTTGTYSQSVALYRFYKVQVKATSSGNQGTAQAHLIAK